MDVLEVEVKESEVLSLDLREEFPDGGMKCQVPGRGDKRYFIFGLIPETLEEIPCERNPPFSL